MSALDVGGFNVFGRPLNAFLLSLFLSLASLVCSPSPYPFINGQKFRPQAFRSALFQFWLSQPLVSFFSGSALRRCCASFSAVLLWRNYWVFPFLLVLRRVSVSVIIESVSFSNGFVNSGISFGHWSKYLRPTSPYGNPGGAFSVFISLPPRLINIWVRIFL